MNPIIRDKGACHKNPFMEIHHSHADFGTFSKDYFVINLGPRAGIVAVRNGAVLMTRQYRFLLNAPTWELPGGKVDDGEQPEFAAVRECLEETGVKCRNLRSLVTYFPGLDNFNNRTSLFFSDDTSDDREFIPNPAEVVEIGWLPLERCLEMVQSGEILDALTVAGLLAYKCFVQDGAIER